MKWMSRLRVLPALLMLATLPLWSAETASVSPKLTPEGYLFAKKASGMTLDGNPNEPVWNLEAHPITHVTQGDPAKATMKSWFDVVWDDVYLYVAFRVNDKMINNNNQPDNALWKDDTVEIFLNPDHSKGDGYGTKDYQLLVRAKDRKVVANQADKKTEFGAKVKAVSIVDDEKEFYTIEVAIPLADLGLTPAKGLLLGLDVAVDNCDSFGPSANRKTAYTWNNIDDSNHLSVAGYGTAVLVDTKAPLASVEGTPLVDGRLDPGEWNLPDYAATAGKVTFASRSQPDKLFLGAEVTGTAPVELVFNTEAGKQTWALSSTKALSDRDGKAVDGVQAMTALTKTGYTFELGIPWSVLGVSPTTDASVGFDLSSSGISWVGTPQLGSILLTNPNVVPPPPQIPSPAVLAKQSVVTPLQTAVSGLCVATDTTGSTLGYSLSDLPTFGSADLDADHPGRWTYTPTEGFTGVDRFKIDVSNDQGGVSTITVQVVVTPPAANRTLYVNQKKGSDKNSGLSEAKAFQSIQAAADASLPGDTVLIAEGTYEQRSGQGVLTVTRSGLPGHPITFKAAPGAKPVLTVRDAWNVVLVAGASYIRLEGLQVVGNQDRIGYDQAMKVYRDMVKAKANGFATADWYAIGTTNGNGIYIREDDAKILTPHHIEIRNCTVTKVPGGAIGASYADYVTIENNQVWDNCKFGAYAGSGISLYEMADVDGSTEKFKNVIRNNVSRDNVHLIPWYNSEAMSDGNGIILDDFEATQDKERQPYRGWTVVENNLVYGNGGSGIHTFSSANVVIRNNTAFGNNVTPGLDWGEIFAQSADNVTLVNNILYGRGKTLTTNMDNKDVVYDYNVYFNGTPAVVGPNDVVADPKFTNKEKAVFTVKAGSPALDTGDPGQSSTADLTGAARPQGKGPDRGAYEK